MSEHASASRHALAEWARVASAELDEIVGRICRPDAHLVLELESPRYWIVRDLANLRCGEPAVMMRADHDLCVRFMRAFAVRHPEAVVDLPDLEFSWRVAQAFGTLSERAGAEAVVDVGGQPHRSSAASAAGSPVRSESVLATVHPTLAPGGGATPADVSLVARRTEGVRPPEAGAKLATVHPFPKMHEPLDETPRYRVSAKEALENATQHDTQVRLKH